jgi:hypothetical protein
MNENLQRRDAPREGTAAHARWTGEGLGLTGEALELFVRGGARARHQARVLTVIHALRRAGALAMGDLSDNPDLYRIGAAECGIALGMLDRIGVGGGVAGLRGRGTTRIPELSACGKGRRHADDGAAWDSAIREAIGSLTAEVVGSEGGMVEVTTAPVGSGSDLQIEVYAAERVDGRPSVYSMSLLAHHRPWARQLAERALMRLGGLPPQPDESAFCARWAFRTEDAASWAATLATVAEEESAEAVDEATTTADRW